MVERRERPVPETGSVFVGLIEIVDNRSARLIGINFESLLRSGSSPQIALVVDSDSDQCHDPESLPLYPFFKRNAGERVMFEFEKDEDVDNVRTLKLKFIRKKELFPLIYSWRIEF